jgi:hypothetical protein
MVQRNELKPGLVKSACKLYIARPCAVLSQAVGQDHDAEESLRLRHLIADL